MHSKAKLALAILTSPNAAFEEILERKLLGTAIFIVALTGCIAALSPLLYAPQSGPLQYFLLGKNNPICWLGLCMLYALGLSGLLKWIGSPIDYPRVLTIMGWSQVLLLLTQAILAVGTAVTIYNGANQAILNLMYTINIGLPIWYVVAIGTGIRSATGVPLSRGILTYMVIAMAVGIALSVTYSNALLSPFKDALPGMKNMAQSIAGADTGPWLVVGVLGLCIGLWQLGKRLEWDQGTILRATASAFAIGAAAIWIYMNAFWSTTDYYGKLSRANRYYTRAQRIYDNNKSEWLRDASLQKSQEALYADCVKGLAALLPAVKDNAGLILDIGDLNYLAGKQKAAIAHYRKFIKAVKRAKLAAPDENQTLARAYVGIGAAYDAQGDYNAAIREFKKAEKAWPDFRDPWVRMAVTYDRMGDYQKAVESADHALKKLDSEAVAAWVAAAQAYVKTGDMKQAKVAITMVEKDDEDLAGRIGSKIDKWGNAVDKLTRQDLRFPLENEPAPKPKKPKGS